MSIKSISEIIKEISPYYKKKGEPEAEHKLVYDSSSETLEPIYFWILDLLNDFGLKPEKLIDNFMSSPGSGHFAELGQRASVMQQQGSKVMGDIGIIIKGILNNIYDLKEFKMRLQYYDDVDSKDKKEAAMFGLKQIWMDKVDIAKGNSSIKAMALGQAGFQTLIDAFLVVQNEKLEDVKGNKIDLNDRVKRILIPRVHEFNIWIKNSETELRKRYEIQKSYLKSQVSNLKLYARWAKPYLKAAFELETKESKKEPELVKIFNTILLELTLLGKSKIDVQKLAAEGDLPDEFRNLKTKRDYYSCIFVDFKFRGIPQRVAQQSHYVFGGMAEVTFRAYALNSDELKKLEQEMDKSDINDALKLVEATTTESLEQMQADIDGFLKEEDNEKDKKPKDNSNPFLALFGRYNKKSEKKEKSKDKKEDKKIENVVKDNWIEKEHIRPLTAKTSEGTAFTLFDIYKKAHGMASYV